MRFMALDGMSFRHLLRNSIWLISAAQDPVKGGLSRGGALRLGQFGVGLAGRLVPDSGKGVD